MSRRRRSIYSMPKLKLKNRTIVAVASLTAFLLAGLSIVAMLTNAATLQFWSQFLFGIFWGFFNFINNKIIKPIVNRPRSFEAKHIPIKVSGMNEKLAVKPTEKQSIMADELVQNVAGNTTIWKYPPLNLLSEKVGSP